MRFRQGIFNICRSARHLVAATVLVMSITSFVQALPNQPVAPLPVPQIYQTTLPWGNTLMLGFPNGTFSGTTYGECGCSHTALLMLLQYYYAEAGNMTPIDVDYLYQKHGAI